MITIVALQLYKFGFFAADPALSGEDAVMAGGELNAPLGGDGESVGAADCGSSQ